jgi:hypothetical protein
MKSQTALVARQYRLQEWTAMIQACKARPETMTVAQWCEENSITTANYYYRLKEVRKSLLENIPAEPSHDVVPVSMNLLTVSEETKETSANEDSILELVSNGITIRVTDKTKPELLIKVLEVTRHVK